MTSISIGELTPSSIAEIEMDEMISIKGGSLALGVASDLLKALPELTAFKGLFITQEVLDDIDSMAFNNVMGLFDYIPVVPAEEVATPSPQIPQRRRGLVF
ncbi:MAG: hypothetical protein QNJ34_21135 [Xenococcaceae cyanobacterium MO_188.B29]|nr:hypothetical protein [Xenococcaceae cyanobacterium MO_188.B29]